MRSALGLLGLLVTTATATADTIVATPPVVIIERPTWNQSYIGLSAGYGELDDVSVEFGISVSPPLEGEDEGGLYGARVGVDKELRRLDGFGTFDRLVGGVVFDAHATDLDTGTDINRTTFDVAAPPCGGADGGSDCFVREDGRVGAELDRVATLRGRLGVANDRLFLYGTAGLAYGRFETSSSLDTFYSEDAAEALLNDGREIFADTPLPAGCRTLSDPDPDPTETPVACSARASGSHDEFGGVLGIGMEYRITEEVSIGAEYLHYEFDESDLDTVSLNLNYRF